MSIRKVVLFSFGLLMAFKANQAATLVPDIVGLRCEFNGAIEFSLKQKKFDAIDKLVNEVKKSRPERLFDASNIQNLKIGQFVNGELNYKFRLESNQWTWIMSDTCIRITLIPYQHIQVYPHRDVYFYNIFDKPLQFGLSRYDLTQFQKDFHIITPGVSDITLDQASPQLYLETFYFMLQPKQAIRYPSNLKLNLTLETSK
jgi:hypothetical protein